MDSVASASPNAGAYMASVSGPDQDLARREIRQRFKQAMGELSEEHRVVIVLREIEGLSYSEISDVVGCSKGTIMSRLHHARKRLQKSLADIAPSSVSGSSTVGESSGEVDSIEEVNESIEVKS